MKLKNILLICLATTLLAACDSGGTTTAVSIHFRSKLFANLELPVPREPKGGILVGLYGLDASGKTVDLNADTVSCESSNLMVFAVRPLGTALIVTALADRFDARPPTDEDDAGTEPAPDGGMPMMEPYGMEPEAVIICVDGKMSAEVTARGVVNGAGIWRIEKAGVTEEIELEQVGRDLFVPGTTEPSGNVQDDVITLNKDDLILTGVLDSRDSASGMIGPVEWRARKDP